MFYTHKLFKNPNHVKNYTIKTPESQGFSLSDTLEMLENQEHQNGGFNMAAVQNSWQTAASYDAICLVFGPQLAYSWTIYIPSKFQCCSLISLDVCKVHPSGSPWWLHVEKPGCLQLDKIFYQLPNERVAK